MMSSSYISLWLEGPLQSWGFDSKFGRRESLDFPTKSGVLGLLLCALGRDGAQKEWLREVSPGDMQVFAFCRRAKENYGPRHVASRLCDFHMVGSGFDDKDPWENLLIPKTETGKKAVGGGAKMTFRYYLQDISFGVLFEVPRHMGDELCEALRFPKWDLYLGRKCCVPSEFILQGLFDDVEEAYASMIGFAEKKQRTLSYTVKEGAREGEVLCLNDVPVQLGKQKRYRERRVTVVRVTE